MPAADEPDERAPLVTRRGFLRLAGAGTVMVVAAAGSGAMVREAYRFVIERPAARIDGLTRPLRVALLADLHYGPYIREGSLTAWVDATLEERPDLILLCGDLIDARVDPDRLEPMFDQLARLRAPLGTWAVWGNHEHGSGLDLDALGARLEDAGAGLLNNRGVRLGPLYLAGVDDLRADAADLDAALADRPADLPCLLLSHNPDVLPQVPRSVAATLAGHTHGGQICLPGVGPLYTSSRYGRRFASGWVEAPARGYVTRGLGVVGLPLRLACPAELTILELSPG